LLFSFCVTSHPLYIWNYHYITSYIIYYTSGFTDHLCRGMV